MRLKSSIWISALQKAEEARGSYFGVLKKGNEDAGAIYIIHYVPSQAYCLYVPLPQMFFETDDHERRFEKKFEQVSEMEIRDWLQAQERMDSDFWVIEIETKESDPLIEIVDLSEI